jgi:hypothetical protein
VAFERFVIVLAGRDSRLLTTSTTGAQQEFVRVMKREREALTKDFYGRLHIATGVFIVMGIDEALRLWLEFGVVRRHFRQGTSIVKFYR